MHSPRTFQIDIMQIENNPQEQLAPMEKVIESSKGMLAPLNGQERLQSVGCGHMSQFIKAAWHGCKTPIKAIQDVNGCIDKAKLKRDDEIQSMLDDGWSWEVFPAQAEETWGPRLADVSQRALNASHEVASSITEIEVAVSMADCVPDEGATTEDWEFAQAAATSGNPPCGPYAHLLRDLAQLYGGGRGAPMLVKLDAFAKQFGENRRLGEEYLAAVVKAKFPNEFVFPRTRDAFLAVNLTSPKVVDGIAKMLSKTDVLAWTAKAKLKLVSGVEKHLELADVIADAIMKHAPVIESEIIAEEGLFKIRLVCKGCNKGSNTFEQTDYKTDTQIIAKYLEAITNMLERHKIEDATWLRIPAEWTDALSVDPSKTIVKKEAVAQPLTTSEVTSKAVIAKRKGFEVGGRVVERSISGRRAVFTIGAIGDVIELSEVDNFKEDLIKCTVPFDTFLIGWSSHTGDIPTYVRGKWELKYIAEKKSIQVELVKCKLFTAINTFFSDMASNPDCVRLCLKPNGLRALKDIAKGELVLVPLVSISSIMTVAGSNTFDTGYSATVNNATVSFYIGKPSQPRIETFADWGEDDYANPFWWVTPISDEEQFNMTTKRVTSDGITFKVLVNKQKVSSMELLRTYEAAVEKTSLSNATIIPSKESEPMHKKQRKKA